MMVLRKQLLLHLLISQVRKTIPTGGRQQRTVHNRQNPQERRRSHPFNDRHQLEIPIPPHRRTTTDNSPTDNTYDPSTADNLRNDLLNGYDRGSFPWEVSWRAQQNASSGGDDVIRQGIPIEVGINFHRIFEVDVTNALADLVVWFRIRWTDPRLAWDPVKYNNMSTTWFFIQDGTGPGGETSEIWTPDLELWNQETSLSKSLQDSTASVTSDGKIFWSRPGHLRSICKFYGLQDFPFDTLNCTLEIGSWAYSGLYFRPTPFDGTGYSVGGSDTAGELFAEFSLADVACEERIYPPFPNAPEEDWPVLLYHLRFKRAWQPYARGYLLVQIVLNLAAFACFWLPPHLGERMALAITSLLAAVASDLAVASSLPATT